METVTERRLEELIKIFEYHTELILSDDAAEDACDVLSALTELSDLREIDAHSRIKLKRRKMPYVRFINKTYKRRFSHVKKYD